LGEITCSYYEVSLAVVDVLKYLSSSTIDLTNFLEEAVVNTTKIYEEADFEFSSIPNIPTVFDKTACDSVMPGFASKGVLSFCVKVESFFESGSDVSVSFQKQKISLSYDLTDNSFSVEDNGIGENAISTEQTDVDKVYTVVGFRCSTDSFEKGSSPTLTQNQVIFICIRPGEADVEISNFEMEFKRNKTDTTIFTAVEYGKGDKVGRSPTGLSVISHDPSTSTYRVASRLITSLFADGAESFDVVGNAYLAFKTTRRQLKPINTPSLRAVQEGAGNSPFKLGVMIEKVNVVPQAQSNLSAVTVLLVMGGIFSIVFVLRKMMKQ